MNWICALGVLPFYGAGLAGKVVALNGLAFHLFFADVWLFKAYDIAVNFCILLYYNAAVWPNSSVLSLSVCGSACFVANGLFVGKEWVKSCFHVLFVQWPLLAALVVASSRLKT